MPNTCHKSAVRQTSLNRNNFVVTAVARSASTWNQRLRRFGIARAVGDEAIDRVGEGDRGAQEFHADQIPRAAFRRHRPQMTDARGGKRRLPVKDQAHALNGFDGEGLRRLDQYSVPGQILDLNRIAGVERAPELAKHFEADTRPAIARSSHRPLPSISLPPCAIRSPRLQNWSIEGEPLKRRIELIRRLVAG